jgi:hypothetical protein
MLYRELRAKNAQERKEDGKMTNTDKTAEKAEAIKTTETAPDQEELSAEELSKIAGGDIYAKPSPRGIN